MRKDEQKLQAILFDAYIGRSDEVEEELKACGIEPDQAEIDARNAHVFPKKQLTTEEFLAEMAAHKAKKEAAAAGASEIDEVGAAEYREVYVRKSASSAAKAAGHRAYRRSLTAVATIAVVATAILGASVLFSEPVGADRDRTEHEGKYGDMHTIEGVYSNDPIAGESFEYSTQQWDEVAKQKDYLPELRIPESVPDGYEFASLRIVKEEDTTGDNGYRYKVEYLFEKGECIVGIMQQLICDMESMKTFSENEYDKTVSGDLTIYVQEYEENESSLAISFVGSEKLSVTGNLTKLEAIEVIKNFK